MREESSVALNRLIDEPHFGITYLEAVEEELQKTKKELERERTIREHYESVLLKYPVKEEKEEFKIIIFPELWKREFIKYRAEEKEEIKTQTKVGGAGVTLLDKMAQLLKLKIAKISGMPQTLDFLRSNLDHVMGLAACFIVTSIAALYLPYPANVALLFGGMFVIASGVITVYKIYKGVRHTKLPSSNSINSFKNYFNEPWSA